VSARGVFALLSVLVFFGVPRAAIARGSPEGAVAEPAPEDGGSDYLTSSEGRRFRVRFDPASRIWFGISAAMGRRSDRPVAFLPEVGAGLSYRSVYKSGIGTDQVIWQIDQRVLAGWAWPLSRPVENVPALDMTLYAASLLRHDEAPSIVLPLSPPVSVPFPFDVGLEAEVGRVFVPSYLPVSLAGGAPVPMVHIGVVRAAALIDPWRSGEPGRSFEIGAGVRYDLDAYAEPTLKTPKVVHRVAPMTAASLRFRFQTEDGLTGVDCRGDVIPHWTSESTWKLSALSAVHLERTLIAINDQPIAAVLDGDYRLAPSTKQVDTTHDFRVSLGFAFALPLK
jgi:hypothetical protein